MGPSRPDLPPSLHMVGAGNGMAHAHCSRLRFHRIEIRDMERDELIETSRLGMKWEIVPGV